MGIKRGMKVIHKYFSIVGIVSQVYSDDKGETYIDVLLAGGGRRYESKIDFWRSIGSSKDVVEVEGIQR